MARKPRAIRTPEEQAAAAEMWKKKTGGLLAEALLASAPMSGGDAEGHIVNDEVQAHYRSFRNIPTYVRLSLARLDKETGEVVNNNRTRIDLEDWPKFVDLVLKVDEALTAERLSELADEAQRAADATDAPGARGEDSEFLGACDPVKDGDRTYTVEVRQRGKEIEVRLLFKSGKTNCPPRIFSRQGARKIAQCFKEAADGADEEARVLSGGSAPLLEEGDDDADSENVLQ